MFKTLVAIFFLFSTISCDSLDLENIKIFQGNSEEQAIIYKYQDEEIIIRSDDILFNEYFAVSGNDLKIIYLKLKKCENKE